ncbi:MAG: hypothetical protein BGO01_01160 [Armatimonadetes bacterium 55-13]|nr:helix-turn-helix transcriptional regulator [Armatimonadota bacterium]ODU51584.1 MAG: hypothetical protein ABT09_03630 [bacterium SCN 57-13]OJU65560.1 MAG: hypothetical protein BGO01_01160 [Armatimonadetes bacterium 55-13]
MSRRRIAEIIEGRDPNIFARNVKRARESLGWTRQQLCQAANISPQTLTKIENGQGCTPGVEAKLAAAVGTVVGRLWERQELPHQLVRRPETDRWYFSGPEEGERYWQRHGDQETSEVIRFDPDGIQEESERQRMGWSGLAKGFVRVTTAHLQSGSIISSVLEVYGRIDSELPNGRLAYFYAVRGAFRFHVGQNTYEVNEGDAFQAQMESPAWLEPAVAVAPGLPPPILIYVDVTARTNRRKIPT